MARRARKASLPPSPALAAQDDTALQTPGPVRDRLIAQMRRQGVKDVRINAIYGRVKAEGYGKIDDEVNALRAAGIRPQMTLMGTPSYSPQWDQTLNAQHNNPRVWQQFAADTARHFKGRVGRYSVGNEPNWPAFIAGADKNPRAAGIAYRGIYHGGRAGIKGVDPHAEVLAGELSSAPNAAAFLKAFLGGKRVVTEGLAYHPYVGAGGWDINSLPALQKTLASYKRQGRLQTAKGKQAPLYLTEFGTQRGTMPDPDRLKQLAVGYAKARQAGARQFLQYQLTPSVRRTVTTPGQTTTDGYGGMFQTPGSTAPAGGFVWDTGIADAAGNLPVINRGLKLAGPTGPTVRTARTARARTARKQR
jgi:hypothetical protein